MKRANVRWLTKGEGGRDQPPTGKQYITVARFPHASGDWSSDAWSVIVRFIDSPQDAEVSFLVTEAPDHLLQSGSEFELFEGAQRVAVVTVL